MPKPLFTIWLVAALIPLHASAGELGTRGRITKDPFHGWAFGDSCILFGRDYGYRTYPQGYVGCRQPIMTYTSPTPIYATGYGPAPTYGPVHCGWGYPIPHTSYAPGYTPDPTYGHAPLGYLPANTDRPVYTNAPSPDGAPTDSHSP